MVDPAALRSTASSLDELVGRITQAADALVDDHEDLATDLYEVERALRTGARRLATVLRSLEA